MNDDKTYICVTAEIIQLVKLRMDMAIMRHPSQRAENSLEQPIGLQQLENPATGVTCGVWFD